MHARGLLLVVLLATGLLALLPGAAADVGVGYRADAPTSASVNGSDLHEFTLEIEVETAEGEDAVDLTASYANLSGDAIAPSTDLEVRDLDGSSPRDLGSVSGFGDETSTLQLPGGKHRVHAEVDVPNREGNHTAYLRLTARSLADQASSASSVYDLTYDIQAQGLTIEAPDGPVDASAEQRFEAATTGPKPVDRVTLVLDDQRVDLASTGNGSVEGAASTCGTLGYRFEVTYADGRSLLFPEDGLMEVRPPDDPEADLSVSPVSPEAGEEVTFTDASEADDACPIEAREWAFGDGATGTGPTTTHVYGDPGTYEVTLRVEQEGGAVDVVERSLSVAASDGDGDDGEPTEPLRIASLVFQEEESAVTLQVSTNRPAEGEVTLEGDGDEAVRSLGPGTEVEAAFPDLDPGTVYRYQVELRPDAGLDARASGVYEVTGVDPGAGPVTKEPASDAVEEEVQTVVPSLEDGGLLSVDEDGDGEPDRLEAPGTLEGERSVPDASLHLMRGGDGGLVLVDLGDEEAHPVDEPAGEVASEETRDDHVNVTVEVPAKSGWIYVDAPDARPDAPLEGIVRGDGKAIPGDLVWREDTRLRVLDDPDTRYHVLYGVEDAQVAEEGGVPATAWVVGVAVVLLVVAVGVYLVRSEAGEDI